MKLRAVVFVFGSLLAVVSAGCREEHRFAVAFTCGYTLREDPDHRAVAEQLDAVDLSDPAKARAVCCYLKAAETCLKDGLQGECSYAADELLQEWRVQMKAGDLSCVGKC
ncbi:uncharacterized protein LOC135372126 [Ornithodoros turicata]|uniref:uncharacterized protein LOC135372126 n=1 Tax=Ornithodoros turicata TaxID=34597 RepID=UPI003139D2C4